MKQFKRFLFFVITQKYLTKVSTLISEMIQKAAENKTNTDVKPNKLSEINPVNDLTDSVRGKIKTNIYQCLEVYIS